MLPLSIILGISVKTMFADSIGPAIKRKAKQTSLKEAGSRKSSYPAKANESKEIEPSATTPNETRSFKASFAEASVIFFLSSSGIYNSFIEWAKAGMSEPVEKAVERVRDRLRLVADSIETGLTNSTQNKRL